MPFDAVSFQQKLSATLPTVPKPVVAAAPPPTKTAVAPVVKPTVTPASTFSPSNIALPSTKVANSTPQASTGIDTVGAIKLLNPMHKVTVRPAFNTPTESQQIYGGPIVAGAHNLVARTVESIPNIILRTIANAGQLVNKGQPTSIKVPFDTSRIGIENNNAPTKLVGADLPDAEAQKLEQQYTKQGQKTDVKVDPLTGAKSVYTQAPSNEITDTGTQLVKRFTELEKQNPGRTKTNIALATLEGPVTDALNAFVVGDLLTSAAKTTLKVTGHDPSLDWALQTYGVKNSGLTGEGFIQNLSRQFNTKAARLTAAEDTEGLNRLGMATNIILTKVTGRGVPTLSKIGQVLEDAARTGLQDSKYGFHLQHPMYPELAPEGAAAGVPEALPGTREVPGQAMPIGMSTRRVEKVGGAEPKKPESFEGFEDLSTKTLDKLKGKTTVSKQFISDLTNAADLKQPERDLLRSMLESEGVQVNVKDFADKVRNELLPLERTQARNLYSTAKGDVGGRYESVNLPDELRGPVADYKEHIYQSPVKTSAGDVHFGQPKDKVQNYFGHTRVEDLPDSKKAVRDINPESQTGEYNYDSLPETGGTRRVIEVQSDLFQKGRLENEGPKASSYNYTRDDLRSVMSPQDRARHEALYKQMNEGAPGEFGMSGAAKELGILEDKAFAVLSKDRVGELAKLEPYKNNAAHFRMIREEVKQAAKDGKTKLQFPTGETAMKIEGLGETTNWVRPLDEGGYVKIKPEELKVGQEVSQGHDPLNDNWIITDVLRDGKFKAVPKSVFDKADGATNLEKIDDIRSTIKSDAQESFDISGKVDTENPIYKFYEKEVGKYLKNHYGAEHVTDPQGQTWWEVPVKEEYAKKPVEAFGLGAGVQEDDDKKKVKYNPALGILGLVGAKVLGPEFRALSEAVLKELAAETDLNIIRTALIEHAVMSPIADALAPSIALATTPVEVERVIQNQIDLMVEKQPPSERSRVKKAEEQLTLIPTEEESLNLLSQQQDDWVPALRMSTAEEAKLDDDLTSVFADLKGVKLDELNESFTDKDLEEARNAYEFALDTLLDHPGRALMKYAARTGEFEGRLPDLKRIHQSDVVGVRGQNLKTERTDRTRWEREGDVIFQNLIGQEASKQGDLELAQEMLDNFLKLKEQTSSYKSNLQKVRKTIRLQKAKDKFVESSRRVIGREVAKDTIALKNLVEAARRTGVREGVRKGQQQLKETIQKLKGQRSQLVAMQKGYDLTDKQMFDIRGNRDWRFMDPEEFDQYVTELHTKALEQHQKNIVRQAIGGTIEDKQLEKTDNLRHAMELPPLNKMSLKQLQEFENELSRAKQHDTFLGSRMIQTLENTDLAGAKTVREIRQALADETGYDYSQLGDIKWHLLDDVTYDSALAERNPLYKYMVTSFTAKSVENAQTLAAIQHRIEKLAKASRASRAPIAGKEAADKLVPQDPIVFGWLETPEADQSAYAKARNMTPQELEYGTFVKELYRQWRDTLIEKGALKKWREAYVTHTTRTFLERWKDDGFVSAIGNTWKDLTDQRVDFDALGDTGQVLGLEKFFKFSLPRSGSMKPSTNVAKVVMSYANSFYKKQALDAMIPKLEAYTFSLQRNGGPTDPTGLGIDGKLRQFVHKWVNNKKGRRWKYFIPQGGKFDAGMRAFKMFLSMFDLGFNLISQPVQIAGAEMSNFIGLEGKQFAQGTTRSFTKEGKQILKKYPGVVGEPPFERLISELNDAGNTFTAGAFYIMQEVGYRTKGQFFLGSLTPQEFESGIVTAKRQAEIKLEMGKFHPMEDMSSVAGATPEGKIVTMYKTWAVPFIFTAARNMKRVVQLFKEAESAGEGAANAAKSKEARQLLKLTIGTVGVYLFWQTVFGNDDGKDTSVLAQVKRRITQELTSSLSSLDPKTWLSIRAYDFAKNTADAIHSLVLLETYKSDGSSHKKGDLVGVSKLEQQFVPAILRQFLPGTAPQTTTNVFSSPDSGTGSGTGTKSAAMERLKKMRGSSTTKTSPAMERLKKLRDRSSGTKTDPALGKLKKLRARG